MIIRAFPRPELSADFKAERAQRPRVPRVPQEISVGMIYFAGPFVRAKLLLRRLAPPAGVYNIFFPFVANLLRPGEMLQKRNYGEITPCISTERICNEIT